jgi:hypothetical protein
METETKPPLAPSEKMNIADNASLIFFTNPHYYNILQRKNLCNQPDNKEEIKFYRKRIVSLFKDLMKDSIEEVNSEIKEIHRVFVNSAIRYFEMTDKKDIIQSQHIQSQHIQSQHIQSQHIQSQHIQSGETPDLEGELLPEDLLNTLAGPELFTLDEANELMTRKTITVANLDNYVVTKQDLSANEMRIIPMKMEIDLKTTDLKTKGVPPKKTHRVKK